MLVHFSTEVTGVISSAAAADVGEDADVRLGADEDASTRLVARVSPKSRIALGQQVELAVDTTRLYFFDPETRGAIQPLTAPGRQARQDAPLENQRRHDQRHGHDTVAAMIWPHGSLEAAASC